MIQSKLKASLQKKNFLTCFFSLVFCTSFIFSQDFQKPPKLQVSIQPSLGYKGGSIGEYLFNMNGVGKSVDYAPAGGKQLSYLQWDVYAMVLAELEVGFRYKAFHAQVTGEVGFPSKSGKMEDYDWQSTKGHQTNFSTHNGKLDSHFSLGGLLGWEFRFFTNRFCLTPLVGFHWQKTAMTGSYGYYQYVPETQYETTPWTDSLPKGFFKGAVINYSQELYQIDCALRFLYNHNSHLRFTLDASIHPVLAAYGYDTHILKKEQYLDYEMKGGVGLGVALSAAYQVLPKHWLTLKVDYNYMPVVVGQTYSKGVNQKYYSPVSSSRGGASHWFVGVSLGWKFNLFR